MVDEQSGITTVWMDAALYDGLTIKGRQRAWIKLVEEAGFALGEVVLLPVQGSGQDQVGMRLVPVSLFADFGGEDVGSGD